jgi:hypothetical protein
MMAKDKLLVSQQVDGGMLGIIATWCRQYFITCQFTKV